MTRGNQTCEHLEMVLDSVHRQKERFHWDLNDSKVSQANSKGKRISGKGCSLCKGSKAGILGRILGVCPRKTKKGRVSCRDLTRGLQGFCTAG